MKYQKKQMFETYKEMCKKVAEEIREDLKRNPKQMLCIAAGNTSLGVFEELICMYEKHEVDFSEAYFVAMDEWMGMDERTPGSCGNFLVKYFLQHVNYASENIKLWNGKAADPYKECLEAEAFLNRAADKCIDYLVLGTGMNGHLALNEPGADFDGCAHVHELDETTKKVGQKYFEQQATLEQGITLGIRNFRDAKRTVLMINGAHKKEIAKRIFETNVPDCRIPATALYDFPNGSIYYDRDVFA